MPLAVRAAVALVLSSTLNIIYAFPGALDMKAYVYSTAMSAEARISSTQAMEPGVSSIATARTDVAVTV